MVKILITTIQVNFVPIDQAALNSPELSWVNFVPIDQAAPNSPELSLLNFLPLTYHYSHFLAATLDFTSFFAMAFLGPHLFYSLAVFD